MKRRLLQLTLILTGTTILLLFFSVAMAGTIGNPTATVEQGSFRVGAEIDLTERDIEDDDGGESVEAESNRYIVRGTYGISDQINVYAKLGMADCTLDDLDFEGDNEVTYGGGLKATIYDEDELKIGVVVQLAYFSSEDSYEEDTYEEDSYDYYYYHDSYSCSYSEDIELTWWEYEIAVGASYEGLENFVPYGGIFYSKIDGEAKSKYKSKYNYEWEDYYGTYSDSGSDSGSETSDFEESDSIGIFVGADYAVSEQFNLGAEARLINETSFSFLASYAF